MVKCVCIQLYTVLNTIAATFSDVFWSQSFTFVRYLIINSLFMREILWIFVFKTVDGGHLGFGGHIRKIKFASYSNMKKHIQMHLCAKFHACMIKFCCTGLHLVFLIQPCIVLWPWHRSVIVNKRQVYNMNPTAGHFFWQNEQGNIEKMCPSQVKHVNILLN